MIYVFYFRIFKIAVDSAFANTVPIVIEDIVVGVSNMCGSVKITGFNKDIRVGEIVNPTPKIKILSVSGAPLQKAYVKLDSRFSSDGPTDLPSGILPNLLMEDGHVSNENGEVILNDFKVEYFLNFFTFFRKKIVVGKIKQKRTFFLKTKKKIHHKNKIKR